jgi:hypothetical protein
MPAIADPYRGRAHGPAPDPTGHFSLGHARPISVRVRTFLRRTALTRMLAQGSDASASHELALRAEQLTGVRRRRGLVRTLRRTLAQAHRSPRVPAPMMMFRRSAVLEAEAEIKAMIDRVSSRASVCPEGMALADLILTNADRSPLYTPSPPGSLRRAIVVATAAMDPWLTSEPAHEFPLAA